MAIKMLVVRNQGGDGNAKEFPEEAGRRHKKLRGNRNDLWDNSTHRGVLADFPSCFGLKQWDLNRTEISGRPRARAPGSISQPPKSMYELSHFNVDIITKTYCFSLTISPLSPCPVNDSEIHPPAAPVGQVSARKWSGISIDLNNPQTPEKIQRCLTISPAFRLFASGISC
jgi:hypothetical protein